MGACLPTWHRDYPQALLRSQLSRQIRQGHIAPWLLPAALTWATILRLGKTAASIFQQGHTMLHQMTLQTRSLQDSLGQTTQQSSVDKPLQQNPAALRMADSSPDRPKGKDPLATAAAVLLLLTTMAPIRCIPSSAISYASFLPVSHSADPGKARLTAYVPVFAHLHMSRLLKCLDDNNSCLACTQRLLDPL